MIIVASMSISQWCTYTLDIFFEDLNMMNSNLKKWCMQGLWFQAPCFREFNSSTTATFVLVLIGRWFSFVLCLLSKLVFDCVQVFCAVLVSFFLSFCLSFFLSFFQSFLLSFFLSFFLSFSLSFLLLVSFFNVFFFVCCCCCLPLVFSCCCQQQYHVRNSQHAWILLALCGHIRRLLRIVLKTWGASGPTDRPGHWQLDWAHFMCESVFMRGGDVFFKKTITR